MQEKRRYKIWIYLIAVIVYFSGMVISMPASVPQPVRYLGDTLEIIVFYAFVAKGMSLLTGKVTKSKTAKFFTVIISVCAMLLRIVQAIEPKFNDETYFLFIIPFYLPLLLLIWYLFWKDEPNDTDSGEKKKRFTLKRILIILLLLLISLTTLALNIYKIFA